MNLRVSFVPSAGWSLPWVLGAAGSVASVLLVLLVTLIVDWRAVRDESEAMSEWLRTHAQSSAAQDIDAPDLAMLMTLSGEVSRINRVTGVQGRPVPVVLHAIERVLPETARLRELRYRHRGGELNLTAELRNAEELSEFLRRLEADRSFDNVLLVRQSRQVHARGEAGLLVELRLTETGGG